jgi:hypothetical protein
MELFLSLQDPRELPKGSRDPLGFEIIWTRYGRKIISNLTTITNSIEEFLTALYGFYLSQFENDNEQRNRFIRYEQLAGYLRQYANIKKQNSPGGFVRGVTRVIERLQRLENRDIEKVMLSPESTALILSNQITYGLWGLYSTSLEMSGLINSRKMDEEGKNIVSKMESADVELRGFLENKIKQNSFVTLEEIKKYSQRFVDLLLDRDIRKKLLEFLLIGNKKNSLQESFFNFLNSLDGESWDNIKSDVWRLFQLKNKMPKELSEAIDNIDRVDKTLWLCNKIFDYLRLPQWSRKNLNDICSNIKQKNLCSRLFSLPELPSDIDNDLKMVKEYWNRQNIKGTIEVLLKRHIEIMNSRYGAPWVEIRNNEIKIRKEEPRATLDFEKFGHAYDYFLSSYLNIYAAYREIK